MPVTAHSTPTSGVSRVRELRQAAGAMIAAGHTRHTLRDSQPVVRIADRDQWRPAKIAAATGYSVSHIARVFSDSPGQRRWRWAAEAFVVLGKRFGLTPSQYIAVVVEAFGSSPELATRQPYYAPAIGFTRIAEAMQVSVDELLEIVLGEDDE